MSDGSKHEGESTNFESKSDVDVKIEDIEDSEEELLEIFSNIKVENKDSSLSNGDMRSSNIESTSIGDEVSNMHFISLMRVCQ